MKLRITKKLNRRFSQTKLERRQVKMNERTWRSRPTKTPLIPIHELFNYVWSFVDWRKAVNPKSKYKEVR